MRMINLCFAVCFALTSLQTAGQAGIILSVDMDLAAAGIQTTNSATVKVGDSFTAGLVMQMTAPSTLGSYNFSVGFGNGLFLTGRTESAFGSLNPVDNSNGINNATGRAFRFDGVDFGSGQLTPLGPVQIGTLTFNVLSASNTNITPGRFEPSFDVFVAADGMTDVTSTVTFAGGTLVVTAVPEPGSVLLLGACLCGLAVGRRSLGRIVHPS